MYETTRPHLEVEMLGPGPVVRCNPVYGLPYRRPYLIVFFIYKQFMKQRRAKDYGYKHVPGIPGCGYHVGVKRSTVQVGCQRFTYREIDTFAKQQGWDKLVAQSRRK